MADKLIGEINEDQARQYGKSAFSDLGKPTDELNRLVGVTFDAGVDKTADAVSANEVMSATASVKSAVALLPDQQRPDRSKLLATARENDQLATGGKLAKDNFVLPVKKRGFLAWLRGE
jgi:hypothetical protein